MHQLPARSPAQADVVHPLAAHPSGDRQSHPADEAGRPWYPCSWRIALSKRFWQARHPPRYAAFTPPSSPSFRHSSLAELARPLPYGLVADDDAARGQHLLDHAQAEREAEIQPDSVADHLRWE